MYKAILFAPDGAYVTDYEGCKTPEQVWERVEDNGSRWFFYPIVFVIKDKGKEFNLNQRIISAPDNMEGLEGLSLIKIIAEIKDINTELLKDSEGYDMEEMFYKLMGVSEVRKLMQSE